MSSPCGEKSAASGSGDCVFAIGAGEGVLYRDTSSTGLLGGIVVLTLLAGTYLLAPPRPLDKMGKILRRTSCDPFRSEVPGSAQRPIQTIGAAENGAERPIPTSETEQDEDVRSSVSETTVVATGLRADFGSRVMARVQELEDDLSKFCADPSNRITVACRNYILGRVFELA
ncbi:hypothetical protein MRX96_020716 [Rhipicephalus microplus]